MLSPEMNKGHDMKVSELKMGDVVVLSYGLRGSEEAVVTQPGRTMFGPCARIRTASGESVHLHQDSRAHRGWSFLRSARS